MRNPLVWIFPIRFNCFQPLIIPLDQQKKHKLSAIENSQRIVSTLRINNWKVTSMTHGHSAQHLFSLRPSWWSFETSLFSSFIPPPALSCRENHGNPSFFDDFSTGQPSPVSGWANSSHSCRSKVTTCSSITDNIMYTNILVRNQHLYSRTFARPHLNYGCKYLAEVHRLPASIADVGEGDGFAWQLQAHLQMMDTSSWRYKNEWMQTLQHFANSTFWMSDFHVYIGRSFTVQWCKVLNVGNCPQQWQEL